MKIMASIITLFVKSIPNIGDRGILRMSRVHFQQDTNWQRVGIHLRISVSNTFSLLFFLITLGLQSPVVTPRGMAVDNATPCFTDYEIIGNNLKLVISAAVGVAQELQHKQNLSDPLWSLLMVFTPTEANPSVFLPGGTLALGYYRILVPGTGAVSSNTVGYVAYPLAVGSNTVINPFVVKNDRIDALLPFAPNGSRVIKQNAAAGEPELNQFKFNQWSNPAMSLPAGVAFIFVNPGPTAFTVEFVGEVPGPTNSSMRMQLVLTHSRTNLALVNLAPGTEYTIEGSTDLVNWLPIHHFLAIKASYDWFAPLSSTAPVGFFRAKLDP